MKVTKLTISAIERAIRDLRTQIQFTVDDLEAMRQELKALEKLILEIASAKPEGE